MELSDSEWAILEVLWSGDGLSLGEITKALQSVNGWSKNTVYTYLTRMEKKGMVVIDRGTDAPYRAGVSREDCARAERNELLHRVYGGAAGDLIAAFLKDSSISKKEVDRLRQMLDDMEV